MTATRRDFLLGCSAAIAAYTGSRISHASFATDKPFMGPPSPTTAADDRATGIVSDTLIVIFLRGGIDGLQLLAPVDSKHYVDARPESLRVSEKGQAAGLALAHDFAQADFRLHAAAAPLKELYDSKLLAFVHACGITSGTRSHFEAMDLIERGGLTASKPGSQTSGHADTGWITRHLMSMQANGQPLGNTPAFAAMDRLPSSLLGFGLGLSGKQAKSLGFWGGETHIAALRAMYSESQPFHSQATNALGAIEAISQHLPRNAKGDVADYVPAADAKYPNGDLSESLQTLAQLVKLRVGLKVACVDFGGWDMHQSQSYFFPVRTRELSQALHAFATDIRDHLATTTVVIMSEFGRRLKANKSEGTDHGHGTTMMALGANVRGGRIYGRWPGLATEQLDSGADLAVTTDHRMVLGELLVKRAGNVQLGSVFPGLSEFLPLGMFSGIDRQVVL